MGRPLGYGPVRRCVCGYRTTVSIRDLHSRDVGSIPVIRTKIYKIMLVKTTIKEETTIYVGDKLVVMVNEVEVVRHIEDTQD